MQRLSSIAILAMGFTKNAEAYKVRRWADMMKKKPLSEEMLSGIEKQYNTIFTFGHRALSDIDESDSFKVKERFGIDLSDKKSKGSGLAALDDLILYAG